MFHFSAAHSIEKNLTGLRKIEEYATLKSPLHGLHPIVLVLVTFIYLLTTVSYPVGQPLRLVPLIIFPVYLHAASGVPLKFTLGRVTLFLPFILMIALYPVLFYFFSRGKSSLTFALTEMISILIRFYLVTSAAFVLLSIMGFYKFASALQSMGAPSLFVMQLDMLYRYLFILLEETRRVTHAQSLRAPDKKYPVCRREKVSMLGFMILRIMKRSSSVHIAMRARGFEGNFIRPDRKHKWMYFDILFLILWTLLFVVLRFISVPDFFRYLILKVGVVA